MLYHFTSGGNLPSIRKTGVLFSAAIIEPRCAAQRRGEKVSVEFNGHRVVIRDQKPLALGHIRFFGGWDLDRYLRELNSRIFFWPGGKQGPISFGERLRSRYAFDNEALIRCSLIDAIAENPGNSPFCCRFNSGAPRTSNGRKSPRGPETFISIEKWDLRRSDVAEITFAHELHLPETAEIEIDGRWERLLKSEKGLS